MTCKNSIVFPIINAKCELPYGHKGWHRWGWKDKESIVLIKWKGKK